MKLRTRIMASLGLMGLLFLTVIVYTLIYFSSVSQAISQIVERNLTSERYSDILNNTILEIRSEIWNTMVFDLKNRQEQVVELDKRAVQFYQALRNLVDKNPSLEASSEELRTLFRSYYQFGSSILGLDSLDGFVQKTDLVDKFKANQAALTLVLSQSVNSIKENFSRSLTELNRSFSDTTILAFSFAGAVIVLSMLLAVFIARRLTKPLELLTLTARQVSEGDFKVRSAVNSGGEIRALAQAFNLMLEQIEEYSAHMEELVKVRTAELAKANQTIMKELRFAQKIQMAMIPKSFPKSGPLKIAGAYKPMEELGGDFYDVLDAGQGRIGLVIADVSGHGVPAALVTAMVKISIAAHVRKETAVGEMLDKINREIFTTIGDVRQFITMVYCVIDPQKKQLEYCSAGHNEFLVLRSDGTMEEIGPNSGVVGLLADEVFFSEKIPFHPGDQLFLFTDGVTESRSPELKLYTLERLKNHLNSVKDLKPDAMVESVLEQVKDFVGGRPYQDDITVLTAGWEKDAVEAAKGPHSELPRRKDPQEALREAERRFNAGDYQSVLLWTLGVDHQIVKSEDQGSLYHWAASAYYKMGHWDDAMNYWNQTLHLNPGHKRAARNLSYLKNFLARQGSNTL